MPSFPATDTLVNDIIDQLANLVTSQIGGVNKVYNSLPPGPPVDNSLVINMTRFKIDTSTIGKIGIRFTYVIMHFFRFTQSGNDYQRAYLYVPSYIRGFEAWPNQQLSGLSRTVDIIDGGVMQNSYAETPYIILGATIQVLTEIPVPTS